MSAADETQYFDVRGRPVVPVKAKQFMGFVNGDHSNVLARTLYEEWSIALHNLSALLEAVQTVESGEMESPGLVEQEEYDPKAQSAPKAVARPDRIQCMINGVVPIVVDCFAELLVMELRHRGLGGRGLLSLMKDAGDDPAKYELSVLMTLEGPPATCGAEMEPAVSQTTSYVALFSAASPNEQVDCIARPFAVERTPPPEIKPRERKPQADRGTGGENGSIAPMPAEPIPTRGRGRGIACCPTQ